MYISGFKRNLLSTYAGRAAKRDNPTSVEKKCGANFDLEKSVTDDARPGACFVSMRKLSLICRLAAQQVDELSNGQRTRDIILKK